MLKTQAPLKLLLIDDSLDFQLLVTTYLKDCGITCLFATDAVQATSTAVREQPDLILLDIGLPGGGGLLLLERLRANLRTAKIPVVVITAQTTPGLESQVRSQGAEEFLHKPLEKEVLIDTLRRVLIPPSTEQV
ncbi:MAG: response regulator [Nitrospira sp.]